MAKAVKAVGTAIMIVGAVVATGGMALAMGAGVGLLGSASLATSAVLSVGSFSVSAGALLSVGSLVSSIGGSLSQPKVSSAGGALGWVGDPNGPLHFAAGRIAVGGDLRHKAAYGPNDRMYFSAVTVVSDAGPIDAFESFTANDIPVTFDASGKANSSYYANVMWRRTQLGFQPEGSYLASPSGLQGGASLPNWGASHKLSGKAAFILTLSENSKQSAYKGQYPKPRTIIRGLRVYDWRRDSTYPGGSGPQRLNDPSTWGYNANPILWSVKWLLGLWEGPTGKGAPQVDYQVGGIGTRWENIDVAAFTEAANIADTHGWTCAAWPSTDDDKAQVLDAFLQAGGAYYIERAGKASCIHRAAPRVSVATITAADTAGPIELDTSASYLDRKNAGVATYLSEADGWKMTALPEVSSSQWVTEDGGRKRSVPVTYSYVDKAKQAAELMCLALAHTREGISGRIPLKSYMQGIGPGSAFTITEPEFVLDGLKCLCLETSYDANTGVHTVTFVSETDAKYPYAFGQTPNPPPPPALTPVDPTHVSPPLPGDWTITPRPPAPGGGQLPGFDLGGIVSNETATAVIVEYGPTATGPWTQAYQGPPTVTTIPIDGLQPGATYYIAVQYQRNQNYSERYVYGPYTAPLLDPSPTAPTIVGIRNDIEAAFGDIFDVSELVGQTRADLEAADQALAGSVDRVAADLQQAENQLSAAIGVVSSRAETLEQRTASLDAEKASVTALNAQVARIGEVEAVNAAQAAALVDLENGKVALSEYNTLKVEVASARDGSPSLLGKIQSLKAVDLDLQQNKASVQAVSALGVRTESLEADITGLQLVTADLEARKATSEALNAQRVRINDVEAVNAAQALALVDLENGKVALSEYNTIKGEVLAARDGAPSLLGQIQSLKSVDLDLENNKASVASVDALAARTGHTEADIIDLENALANETTARAEAVSQLTARQAINPNQTPNGNFEAGSPVGWELPSGFGAGYSSFNGGWIAYGELTSGTVRNVQAPLTSVSSDVAAIQSSQIAHRMASNDYVAACVMFFDAVYAYIGQTPWAALPQSTDWTVWKAEGYTKPAAAAWSRIVVTTGGTEGFINLRQAKTEAGSVCTIYSSDASVSSLSATVTDQSLAIVDLENQQRLASFRKIAEASGAAPAYYEFVSSTSGGYAAIAAPVVALLNTVPGGDPLVAMEAENGRVRFSEPASVIKDGRRATIGPGFGVAGDLLLWSGPTTVGYGAETVDNGILGISATDGFFGGKTSNGPFDSGPPSASLIGLSTGWTTVATVASKYVYTSGSFLLRADWQATLTPKSPPSEPPFYGLNWRVISTNLSGGDQRVVASGYVAGAGGIANVPMGQPYTLIEGHVSNRGDRRFHLQLAISGTDDVVAASARNTRLRGVYYQT